MAVVGYWATRRALRATFRVAHPTLIDPTFATTNRYAISGYPTLIIVDRHGVIRHVHRRATSYAQLAMEVEQVLR